jgi:hypothetical protein
MLDRATIEKLDREALIELVLKLDAQVDALTARVAALELQIEELSRRGKRQATPFSKGEGKADPKPPGRKPGKGPFHHRSAPDPESYSQPPIDVPVTEKSCPDCGGSLVADGEELVTTTEIPPMPKPEVTAYHIQMCRCTACGKRVRGRHPKVAPDQSGATAHRFGDRLFATAHWLHYGVGIPVRKIPGIVTELFGIELTQSALTQDALRRSSDTVGVAYGQIGTEIVTRAAVNADDTGWRIFGAQAWLMGFSTTQETLFQIRSRHRNEEVREVIPATYDGVLQSDRFSSYDAEELDGVRQQKCLAHIQRNLREIIDKQHGPAKVLPIQLKKLFGEAIDLWHSRASVPNYWERVTELQQELNWLLWPRRLRSPINDRIVAELGWHNDRGNLLRFLHEPEHVEPTNNAAERALRPAVIARKVSQCSKTDGGADAHAKFTSVIVTAAKRGAKSIVDALCGIFATGSVPASFAD